MNKEKVKKLEAYSQKLKNRLTDPTPFKHKDHPETYKAFLLHELEIVTSALEKDKLEK